MPSATITKLKAHSRPHRHRPEIIDQVKHALEQLELQSQYPGLRSTRTSPQANGALIPTHLMRNKRWRL